MILTDPGRLWYISTRLFANGSRIRPRLIKLYNFVVFRAILPPEAVLAGPVSLGHYGMNVVIHPNVRFGKNCHLWHGVTIAVSGSPGGPRSVIIEDGVVIGAGAVVVSREDEDLLISENCRVGANAVVPRSLNVSGTYVASKATLVRTH